MPPGPPPKPIEQKLREGNRSKQKLPQPLLVSGRPNAHELDQPPDDLPVAAQEFWVEVVWRLVDVGIVDRVDIPLLTMLATAYARVVQAREVIEDEGLFTTGSVGQVREHPAVKIEREAVLLFDRLGQQFALSPLGRTRLGLAEVHRRSLAVELADQLGTGQRTVVD